MERNEHKNIVTQLLGMCAPENQGKASELLTQLSEDNEKTMTEFEKATADLTKLSEDYETLRDVNSKLFLKVGTTQKEARQESDAENHGEGGNETPLSYDALFNEKGELK